MKSAKGEKNEGIPADIETIYDHGLTEEERLQWFKLEYFCPKTKEEYLQRLKRYKNPKSILNHIWHDLFTLYFRRGDWAKAKGFNPPKRNLNLCNLCLNFFSFFGFNPPKRNLNFLLLL
jgi:hypothetical protein